MKKTRDADQRPKEPELRYQKPKVDFKALDKVAKAFACKSGMGSC